MARPARGISMIELLVVVGIIGILLAILLPSLHAAREQAIRAQCLNNMRQIGLAIAIYVRDHKELPPPDPAVYSNSTLPPVWYACRSGLLVLRGDDSTASRNDSFGRWNLACPEGWASGGDANWYESRGISRQGTAYMDYAYWARRFAPAEGDIRAETFRYREGELRRKILLTDVVVDLNTSSKIIGPLGIGNHGTQPTLVQMTDGRGHKLRTYNRVGSSGGSVLFSDGSAMWFERERFTQQVDGVCFPPPDQWDRRK